MKIVAISLSLVLVVSVCVIASDGQPAALQDTNAIAQAAPVTPSTEQLPAAPEVYKLGAVELPYAGGGQIEYDPEEKLWIIAFDAPEGWQCTHVGWAFPAGDNIPDEVRKGNNGMAVWLVSGILEADVVDGVLKLIVSTDDRAYDFEFAYDPSIADSDLTLAQSEETGALKAVAGDLELADVPVVQDDDCAGGSCSCTNKCSACCSEGFHPRCVCRGAGSCMCLKNKKPDAELQLLDLQTLEYE